MAGAVGAVASARSAVRVGGYLNEARRIPKGVREIGKGGNRLTVEQRASLERFKGKNTKVKNEIEITSFSDGRVVYSVKVPARDIPGSYRIYEKYVDAAGKKIGANAITIGPKGELVHVKPK